MENVDQLVWIKTKNNRILPVCLSLSYMNKLRYSIDVYENDEYDNIIGRLRANFHVSKHECWLSSIRIVDDNWHLKGVGSAMLNLLEDFCRHNKIDKIEGKFYPEGVGACNAEKFYRNKGFEIYKDGYDTFIYKDVGEPSKSDTFSVYPYQPSDFFDLYNGAGLE